jgi:hypothetical protein
MQLIACREYRFRAEATEWAAVTFLAKQLQAGIERENPLVRHADEEVFHEQVDKWSRGWDRGQGTLPPDLPAARSALIRGHLPRRYSKTYTAPLFHALSSA